MCFPRAMLQTHLLISMLDSVELPSVKTREIRYRKRQNLRSVVGRVCSCSVSALLEVCRGTQGNDFSIEVRVNQGRSGGHVQTRLGSPTRREKPRTNEKVQKFEDEKRESRNEKTDGRVKVKVWQDQQRSEPHPFARSFLSSLGSLRKFCQQRLPYW